MGWGEETRPGRLHSLPRCSPEQDELITERLLAAGHPRLATFTVLLRSLGSKLKLFQEYLKGLNRNIGGPGTQPGREESPTNPLALPGICLARGVLWR